ncbi:MAG: HEAT repeat domain-containing protein [Opitutus sp.]
MNGNTRLENLLAQNNWAAADEAQRQGAAALPLLRSLLGREPYLLRQIAMTCVGRIGDPAGSDILAAGLTDTNINVRIAAANELSQKPYPGALERVLGLLQQNPDDAVRETLALAAGHLPSPQTIEVLRGLVSGTDELAGNARMALAKLGDPAARAAMIADLAAPLPRTRYDTVGQLRYVGDVSLAPHARKILADRAIALAIGAMVTPRYRRVCDQVLDTLVYLLSLKVPFAVDVEQIYTDEQLSQVERLTR